MAAVPTHIVEMLDRVEVMPFEATGFRDCVEVCPIWKNVDRPYVGGVVIAARKKSLIERTKRCMESGKFWSSALIATNCDGQSYVQASSLCMGRHLNADLKRLGF